MEANEDGSYDLMETLKEIEQARRNREAQVGIFVFLKNAAPAGVDPFSRHGKQIVVVSDRDHSATDIFLRAGLSVAKALVFREQLSDAKNRARFVALKAALGAITRASQR